MNSNKFRKEPQGFIGRIFSRYVKYPDLLREAECLVQAINTIRENAESDRKEWHNILDRIQEKLIKAQKEIDSLNKQPDVLDAEYWNNKWNRASIYYSAPTWTKVTEYLTDVEIPQVQEIAAEIIQEGADKTNINLVPLNVMEWIEKEGFVYKLDKGEVWNSPEKTLANKNKGNDCDDIMILEYYIIREILKTFNAWQKNRHRLKCQDCHVFNYAGASKIMNYAGRHAALLWLADDGQWYSIESTYYRKKAIDNFIRGRPQKRNPMYGLINYTFNDQYSWAQNSLVVPKRGYKKK